MFLSFLRDFQKFLAQSNRLSFWSNKSQKVMTSLRIYSIASLKFKIQIRYKRYLRPTLNSFHQVLKTLTWIWIRLRTHLNTLTAPPTRWAKCNLHTSRSTQIVTSTIHKWSPSIPQEQLPWTPTSLHLQPTVISLQLQERLMVNPSIMEIILDQEQ